MKNYKNSFIHFAIKNQVLRFGNFTLKSGRISPYFFDIGFLNSGESIKLLGHYYASALVESGLHFDNLMGLAYKGIPIVTSIVIALNTSYSINVPYTFNRKEIKQYGERGILIGSPLSGDLFLVDDVLTAGTAISEIMPLIKHEAVNLVGALICFNRQEKNQNGLSSTRYLQAKYGIKIISIIDFDDIIEYLRCDPNMEKNVVSMLNYKDRYGAG